MNDDLINVCGEIPQFALKAGNVFEPDPMTGAMKFVSQEDMNERLSILNNQVEHIFSLGKRVVRSFVEIGLLLTKIENLKTYLHICRKSEDYPDIFVFANKVFGFSRSTTYGLMNVAKRFGSPLQNVGLKPEFKDYSYSKLLELLPVPDYQLSRYSPEMTVSEIRELRRGWDKYQSVDGDGWREQLHWIREKEAEELNEEKKQTADRKKGLLSLLTGEEAAVPSPVVLEPLPLSSSPDFNPPRTFLSFKTDAECKEFLSIENIKLKWRLLYEISEFNLKFYWYVFHNADSIVAVVGACYHYNGDYLEDYICRLHLLSVDPPFHPLFSMAPDTETEIIAYLKEHRHEL